MSDSRMRIWFSLFVLAVFCVGLASGVLIGRRMVVDVPERFGRPGPGGPGGAAAGRRGGGPPPEVLLQRLTQDLDLDEAQRRQVAAVLEASRERVQGLQRGARERFDAEQKQLRGEIRAVLRPDQLERFDRWAPPARGRGRGRIP